LIRPELEENRESPRGPRRRQNPPDQTFAEEYYYLKQMAAKTAMVIVLNDGEELRGSIEWYDKSAIKFNRKDGPNIVLLKHNIRYMFKSEERRRKGRTS
jgi:sRNA-binding regulator protein Hfq